MENTAVGFRALRSNTGGGSNTAIGYQALQNNIMGFGNTANGVQALFSNNTGQVNTATGLQALQDNTDGNNNTANGFIALGNNTHGSSNTADGNNALGGNTEGSDNTAIGSAALSSNMMSDGNTAVGSHALASATGAVNIALGANAGINITSGDRNIDIGNAGDPGDSFTIRIGTGGIHTSTFIAGIFGQPASGGAAVFVTSDGKLGTNVSSRRFKDEIRPMDRASEAILALQPVTFRYKKEFDPAGTAQFGLVAEDVEKVNPDLVVHDKEGKPYSVRYDQVNAMLLNEFLKEHKAFVEEQRKVREQEATTIALESRMEKQEAIIAQQQAKMETVLARLNEQTAQIQKVSAQVGLSKSITKLAEAAH
jgi:hypothetical protein